MVNTEPYRSIRYGRDNLPSFTAEGSVGIAAVPKHSGKAGHELDSGTRHSVKVRQDLNIGTRHLGNSGTPTKKYPGYR